MYAMNRVTRNQCHVKPKLTIAAFSMIENVNMKFHQFMLAYDWNTLVTTIQQCASQQCYISISAICTLRSLPFSQFEQIKALPRKVVRSTCGFAFIHTFNSIKSIDAQTCRKVSQYHALGLNEIWALSVQTWVSFYRHIPWTRGNSIRPHWHRHIDRRVLKCHFGFSDCTNKELRVKRCKCQRKSVFAALMMICVKCVGVIAEHLSTPIKGFLQVLFTLGRGMEDWRNDTIRKRIVYK